jgi:hypothetical protein
LSLLPPMQTFVSQTKPQQFPNLNKHEICSGLSPGYERNLLSISNKEDILIIVKYIQFTI